MWHWHVEWSNYCCQHFFYYYIYLVSESLRPTWRKYLQND
jgi:hypothetical protein